MRYRTLNRNWQYNRVYGRGKSYVHPHVVLYVACLLYTSRSDERRANLCILPPKRRL